MTRIIQAARLAVPLALAMAALPGCLAGSDPGWGGGGGTEYCIADQDCSGSGVCTRVNECVPSDQVLRVVLHWTVSGVAPSPSAPGPCSQVGDLEVVFHDPDSGDDVNFSPVPCELGQATYDKMPPRLRSVEIDAYAPSGSPLSRAEQPLAGAGETQLDFDLSP